MLVCLSCNVEYKEDKKFCSYCGASLVTKEDLTPSNKNVEIKGEEQSGQKPFCPNCKIIYEFGSSCIQCGSALVTETSPKGKDALEMDVKKPEEEREHPEPQKPEEGQLKAPRETLICPTCKIIYEHGTSCIKCGLTLVLQTSAQTKEEPEISLKPEVGEKPIPLQTFQEQLDETPHPKFICPDCKIIYERGNACVRCGSPLVTEIPSSKKEGLKLCETLEGSPSTPKTDPSKALRTSGQDDVFDRGLEVNPEQLSLFSDERKNLSPVHHSVQGLGDVEKVKKETIEGDPTVKVKEEPHGTETPGRQDTEKPSGHLERMSRLPGKLKVNFRRLFLEVGSISIMVLAGGYFIWSIYSHITKKEPTSKAAPPKEMVGQVPSGSSGPISTKANPSIPQETDRIGTEQSSVVFKEKTEITPPGPPSNAPVADTLEIRKIKDLLDNIRQANLQKNIDLFLSCYATDFKDREGKRRATFDFWKKFDYLDLSYDLRNPMVSGDTAKARVEWLIKISSPGIRTEESKTTLDVTLKKEEGGWKIKEVKQVR